MRFDQLFCSPEMVGGRDTDAGCIDLLDQVLNGRADGHRLARGFQVADRFGIGIIHIDLINEFQFRIDPDMILSHNPAADNANIHLSSPR